MMMIASTSSAGAGDGNGAAGSAVRIFTIGHSSHTWDVFLRLLRRHGIEVVADVRSVPHSRFSPHFSRGRLAAALAAAQLDYAYLGRELGGRPTDPACYENGRIRYARLARSDAFRAGVAGLLASARGRRVAVMCAEKEPLRCHRTLLVAPALEASGADVTHILADGGVEPHAQTMDRLLANFGFSPDGDLLQSRQASIRRALRLQEDGVGFRRRAGG